MKKTKDILQCTICSTELKVPFCCKKEMRVQDSAFICMLCNSEQDIPICCEKTMVVVNA